MDGRGRPDRPQVVFTGDSSCLRAVRARSSDSAPSRRSDACSRAGFWAVGGAAALLPDRGASSRVHGRATMARTPDERGRDGGDGGRAGAAAPHHRRHRPLPASGRAYPGDALTPNDYLLMHDRATELAIVDLALRRFRGEVVLLSEPLRHALEARRAASPGGAWAPSVMSLSAANVRRVLVVKLSLSSMGNVVHVTPCLQALRRTYPTASIAMAVERRFAPIVRHSPHLDEIIEVDRGKGRLAAWLEPWRHRAEASSTPVRSRDRLPGDAPSAPGSTRAGPGCAPAGAAVQDGNGDRAGTGSSRPRRAAMPCASAPTWPRASGPRRGPGSRAPCAARRGGAARRAARGGGSAGLRVRSGQPVHALAVEVLADRPLPNAADPAGRGRSRPDRPPRRSW